jgi:Arc/MetJ-type ribon-helix-helix transcriptional regulator
MIEATVKESNPMEITLAPEHEEYIEASVSSGQHTSRAEALNAAVEELRRRNEHRAYVQQAVAESEAARERGEGTVYSTNDSDDLAREIKAEACARYARQVREVA